MSALRFSRLSLVARAALAVSMSASMAHAQAAPNPAAPPDPAPAASRPADDAALGPDLPAAPAPAAPTAQPAAADAASNKEPSAQKADADVAADAAADAAAAAVADAEISRQASGDVSDEFKLNIYGFADFTYTTTVGPKYALASPYSSFAVGKLNIYTAAELGDNWRSLAEVRFMYLPNGTTPTTSNSASPSSRTNTSVPDYTDLARPVRWGGISIERAWLEHTFHPAFTVRVGSFLTPYGIWNVDHGSPAIIGSRRPFIIGESLFPEHQTGLEAYGALNFGPSQFGYHLTLSNGRGPIDSYQDLDHNKGLGGRLFFKHDSSYGTVTVGVSGYRGKYTDATQQYGVDPVTGSTVQTFPVSARYDELSLATDVKWEWGGLLLQGEGILNDIGYPDSHRPTAFPVTGGLTGFQPDYRRVGIYGLGGYRFAFLGIMPFFGGEYYDNGLNSLPPAAAVWGGLNVRPTARVVLKAQYTHSWFASWPLPDPGNYNGIDLQAAWSF